MLYLHSLLSRESRAVHVQATLVELVLGGRARVEQGHFAGIAKPAKPAAKFCRQFEVVAEQLALVDDRDLAGAREAEVVVERELVDAVLVDELAEPSPTKTCFDLNAGRPFAEITAWILAVARTCAKPRRRCWGALVAVARERCRRVRE